jgi:hypothetical protein
LIPDFRIFDAETPRRGVGPLKFTVKARSLTAGILRRQQLGVNTPNARSDTRHGKNAAVIASAARMLEAA